METTSKVLHRFFWMLLLPAFIFACSEVEKNPEVTDQINESAVLLQYLEENGDFINTAPFPFFIAIDELYGSLRPGKNLLIDLRPQEEFLEGHIENSINMQPNAVLDFFENRIDPNSFEKITLVCSNAQVSAYVVAVLRLLGYDNTRHLRFGLSAWNRSIADKAWFAVLSDTLMGRLETNPSPKNPVGNLPLINTGKSTPREILRERARVALAKDLNEVIMGISQVLNNPNDLYVVSYWPKDLYDGGHIRGSVHYAPGKSLKSSEDIRTLPVDKPVVVYCFTGQTSSYIAAFLTLLGYEGRSLEYGANSFIYSLIRATPPATRAFSEEHIRNYPLVKGPEKGTIQPVSTVKTEQLTVKGGC